MRAVYNDLFSRIKEITGLPVYLNESVSETVLDYITIELIQNSKNYEEYDYTLELIATLQSREGLSLEDELLKIDDKLNREFKFLNQSFCVSTGAYEVGTLRGSNFIKRAVGSNEYIKSRLLIYQIKYSDDLFIENIIKGG